MKTFLRKIHSIDDDVLDAYIAHFEEYAEPARTILTAAGKTEHYLYFVVDGIQKSYYLNEGKQHVIAFTYPPSFSGIPDSFLNQQPSNYFLETLTDSRFLRLSYEQHKELMAEYPPIETLFRKATEHILIGVLQRHYELMAYTIEDRFRAFMKRSPHLINMIPHKDLASYLRIDPTNFSKLLSSVKI